MSSAVFSTSAAQGRPFVFDSENEAEVCPQLPRLFTEARPPQRVVTATFPGAFNSKMRGLPA